MVSVYIHIPFCKSICTYCDFSKLYYNDDMASNYLDVLKKEIKENYNGEEIYTLYIGGGTPSSLSKNNLDKLFNIIETFKGNIEEITFECNLEDINDDLCKYLAMNKVNRLSIGVESTHDKYLKYLGRNYSSSDIEKKILIAKKYFNNISVDLMYAIKEETVAELKEDINFIKKLDVKHISTYSLIIEKHTILGNNNTSYIDPDLDREMYDIICMELDKYHHYEISNFAKKGYESKHNLVYWNNQKYYGFGLSASGYIDDIRYTNTRNMNEYLNGNYRSDIDSLSLNETIENEFILGLRKIDGIDIDKFNKKYNKDILNIDIVKKLLNENKLVIENNNIKIRKDLIYVSNSILLDFIGENYE